MPWYRTADGGVLHLCMSRAPVPCQARREDGSRCAQISGYQCDWKIGDGKTCDRWRCEQHAQQVGPDKHLCPEHQRAYRAWQARREAITLEQRR